MLVYDSNINYKGQTVGKITINTDVQKQDFRNTTFTDEVIFDEGVEKIEIESFKNSNIKSVFLPKSLKTIEALAFSFCTHLKEVYIGENVSYIGKNAFELCSCISNVVLPDSLKIIDEFAFYDCNDLHEIILPDLLEELGAYSFEYCGSLQRIVIPSKVTKIQNGTFSDCRGLKEVILHDNIEYIGYKSFYQCFSLEQIILPEKLYHIDDMAFAECDKLKSIIIPPKNHNFIIENGLFMTSDRKEIILCLDKLIKEYIVPEYVEKIHGGAFTRCAVLESFRFNSTIDRISDKTFLGCKSLKQISLNDKIEYIGDKAFQECSSLEKIILPQKLKHLGDEVFGECTALRSITIPDRAVNIGNFCFSNCKSLVNITLPSKLDSIKDYSFEGCSSLCEIVVPDSVRYIGTEAFTGCSSLKKITLPDEKKLDFRVILSPFLHVDNMKTIVYNGETIKKIARAYERIFNVAEEIICPHLSLDNVAQISKNQFVEGFCCKDKHGIVFDKAIHDQYVEHISTTYRRFIEADDVSRNDDTDYSIYTDLGKYKNTAEYLMKNRMIIYDDVEKVMKSLYKSADTELKTEFLDYVRTIEINDDLL